MLPQGSSGGPSLDAAPFAKAALHQKQTPQHLAMLRGEDYSGDPGSLLS
jgi:hypothetical protein